MTRAEKPIRSLLLILRVSSDVRPNWNGGKEVREEDVYVENAEIKRGRIGRTRLLIGCCGQGMAGFRLTLQVSYLGSS